MPELVTSLLAFPTVIFTGLMGFILLYWLFVILGALDVDMFGGEEGMLDAAAAKGGALDALAAKGEAAGGALDALAAKGEAAGGALDALAAKGGAADGALDAIAAKGGAVDGMVEGALDGAADGAADGVLDGAEDASWLLHAFNLRRAPITVTISFIVFFGWIVSYLAMVHLAPVANAVLPEWLTGLAVLAGALFLSLPATSLATRPLEPIFKDRPGQSRQDFIGSVCRVRSGRVDDRVGQATVEDGGAGLIIHVRGDGTLKRGQQALIIDYDRDKQAYIVEAYDALFETDAEAAARHAAAEAEALAEEEAQEEAGKMTRR